MYSTLNEHFFPRWPSIRPSDPQPRSKFLSEVIIQDIPPLPFLCQRGRSGSPTGCESPDYAEPAINLPHRFHTSSEFTTEPLLSFHRSVIGHQKHPNPHQTQVIKLPWTDGEYTGQVNELIQPHGIGSIQYRDGAVVTSTWCDGIPVGPSIAQGVTRVAPYLDRNRTLTLGDIATPRDMHIEPNPQKAHENAASLQIHSFAFILRSNGQWTYAILANRPVESGPEASIRFVLDTEGRTKTLKSKHWSKCLRLVKDPESQHVVEGRRRKQETRPCDQESARLISFHRAVRRVSLDMSTRTIRN